MNSKLVTLVVILSLWTEKCRAKNFLCLMGIGTESADKWNKVLLKELAHKGHELTIITANTPWNDEDDEEVWSNTKFIYLEKTEHFLQQRYENLTSQEVLEQCTWKYIVHWYDRQMATCRANLESLAFSEIFHLAARTTRPYDAIIYDMTHGPGCLLNLAFLWKDAPIIGLASGHLHNDVLSMSRGSILKPSLDPYMLTDFPTNMNYWRRLQNTFLYIFDYCYREWVVKPVIEGIWYKNKHSKNIHIPRSSSVLRLRLKVILANYHPALHSAEALPVNVVPVPGLHIQQEAENTLAKEYLNFIENTKHDVTLFHMDTQLLSSNVIQHMLQAIQSLPDNGFVWLNGDSKALGKNKIKNLLLANEDAAEMFLDHRKVKCSVLSGNTLRIQEAFFYGVPIVVVPTRPEEKYLARRVVEGSLGISMDFTTFDSALFKENLKRCLTDAHLRKSAHQIQHSLRHQQNPPLQSAIWWVEHVAAAPQINEQQGTKESLGYIAESALDVIAIIQLFIVLCILNSIIVFRQTLLNFTKASKSKKKKSKSEDSKKTKKS